MPNHLKHCRLSFGRTLPSAMFTTHTIIQPSALFPLQSQVDAATRRLKTHHFATMIRNWTCRRAADMRWSASGWPLATRTMSAAVLPAGPFDTPRTVNCAVVARCRSAGQRLDRATMHAMTAGFPRSWALTCTTARSVSVCRLWQSLQLDWRRRSTPAHRPISCCWTLAAVISGFAWTMFVPLALRRAPPNRTWRDCCWLCWRWRRAEMAATSAVTLGFSELSRKASHPVGLECAMSLNGH